MSTATLRLVESEHLSRQTQAPLSLTVEPSPGRPFDRRESWPLSDSAVAVRLQDVADAHGLRIDHAAALLVESNLVLGDLTRVFTSRTASIEFLHSAARTTRVRRPLSAAEASYVRQLTAPPSPPRRLTTPRARVLLPARLLSRLSGAPADEHIDTAALPSALLWEQAAVVRGRTMSEWALAAALTRP
jgi:hypothetical protein